MEHKKVVTFAEYTKENIYKMKDGKPEKIEWYYYKDVYPEKYDLVDGEKEPDSFCWVIKHNNTKIAVLSDKTPVEMVKNIMMKLQKI